MHTLNTMNASPMMDKIGNLVMGAVVAVIPAAMVAILLQGF